MKGIKNLHKLHKRFLSYLERLSEEDLASIEKGEKYIKFSIEKKESTKNCTIDDAKLEKFLAVLYEAEERKDIEESIEELKKTELEELAKKAGIHVNSAEIKDTLIETIVYNTIGHKERHRAIGNNPCNSGGTG